MKQSTRKPVHSVKYCQTSDLFPQMQAAMQETIEIFEFTFDEAIIWLNHFGWNIEKFNEYYTNASSQELKNKSESIGICKQPTTSTQKSDAQCPVCVEKQCQIVLECGHSICYDCFQEHVQINMNNDPFIRCFNYPCLYTVRYSTLKQNFHNFSHYQDQLIKKYLKGQRFFKQCQNKDCSVVFTELHQYEGSEIQCPLCAQYYCLRCPEGDHRPSSCKQVQDWKKLQMSQNKDTLELILQSTKFCPKCREPIEKNKGCNHMTCKSMSGCSYEFCWLCLGPWKEHSTETGGHYKCNSFDNLEREKQLKLANNLDKSKSSMEKIVFYMTRYENHDKAENIALTKSQKKVWPRIHTLVKKYQFQMTEVEFINKTFLFLIKARHILKWTYCYGYYADKSKINIELFEFNQSDFEKGCENLHSLMEIEMPKLVKSADFSKEKFFVLKQKILNLYSATQRFMERFLEGLDLVV